MITNSTLARSLITKIVYNSKQHSRQTTHRLFKNPILTPRGIATKQPRSFGYDLPADLPKRELYWDRTVQNKAQRTLYKANKLYRLGIRPIHIDGKLSDDRNIE
jgi:hypothetical protein